MLTMLLPRPETDVRQQDLVVTHDGADKYTVQMYSEEKRAIRPILYEDRILAVEQKFFCDRTTEKTVTLTVTDNQNTPVTFANSTVRLSCQYPLSAVKDLSESNENNVFNNSWHYIKVEETDCASEVLCKNKLYDNGTVIAREYEASLSARKDERIRFHVKFSKGSHMKFTWMFDEDLGSTHPHVKQVSHCSVVTVTSQY